MKKHRLTTSLGILIVLVLLAIVFPRGRSHDNPEAVNRTRERGSAIFSKALPASSVARSGSPAANRQRKPIPEHRVEDLHLYLPDRTQIKANVVLIHAEQALAIDTNNATPDEIREWLGSLAKQPGVDVVQTPSVTMLDTQEASIEIINGSPTDWTGSRTTIQAERDGLAFFVKDTTEYRPDDRSTPAVSGSSQGVARDGEPQVSVVSSRDGAYLYRVLTLDLIDVTGRPLLDQAGQTDQDVVGTEVPGKPGFVVSPFSGNLIDVRGFPFDTLVRDPTYPAEERKYFRLP